MNKLVKFGKYKDKTYDYVIRNDIKYCNYIINETFTYKYMLNFQNFLKKNIKEYSIKINSFCNDNINKILDILISENIKVTYNIKIIKVKHTTNKSQIYKIDIKNLIQEIELFIKYNKKRNIKINKKINNYDKKINNYDIKSDKIVLDIETDVHQNILQIAYIMYDENNNLIKSTDFYIYDGIHSKPFYPTINEEDIIKYGISLKDASDIITKDINNTNILIGHNIKNFDFVHIKKLNDKFNNKIKDSLIIHDTMVESKYIIKAKDKNGRIKYPRLDEMLMFLCNKSVKNYHNAMGDIIATFDCYKVLCDKYKCFHYK
jgi:DNA polymerase-3 subunit epsilon